MRISLGGNVTQQLRPGLSPALSPSAYSTTHTRAYIFKVNTKPSLYQGPFLFKCLEQSIERRNVHSLRASSFMCVRMLRIYCMFPSKCACVSTVCAYSVFCPCRGAILRASRSWGQRLRVSVTLLSSTEGLSDWWTDGSPGRDEGRRGNRGMSYKLGGITHACTPVMPTNNTTQGEDEGRAKTERKTLCLCRVVANVPWSIGAISCPHKQWNAQTQTSTHTQAHTRTHSLAFSLPSYRVGWKKAWHVVRDRRTKIRKERNQPQHAFTNGCSRAPELFIQHLLFTVIGSRVQLLCDSVKSLQLLLLGD